MFAIPLMLAGFLIGARLGGYFIGALAGIFGIVLTLQLARSLFPEIIGGVVTFTCNWCGSVEKAKKHNGKAIETNDIVDCQCHNCGSVTRIEVTERKVNALDFLESHPK